MKRISAEDFLGSPTISAEDFLGASGPKHDMTRLSPEEMPDMSMLTKESLAMPDTENEAQLLRGLGKGLFELPKTIGDIGLGLGTGMVGWPIGAASEYLGALLTGDKEEAKRWKEKAHEGVWKPQTQGGEVALETIGKAIEPIVGFWEEAASLPAQSWKAPALKPIVQLGGELGTFAGIGTLGRAAKGKLADVIIDRIAKNRMEEAAARARQPKQIEGPGPRPRPEDIIDIEVVPPKPGTAEAFLLEQPRPRGRENIAQTPDVIQQGIDRPRLPAPREITPEAKQVISKIKDTQSWLDKNAPVKGTPMYELNAKILQSDMGRLAAMGVEMPSRATEKAPEEPKAILDTLTPPKPIDELRAKLEQIESQKRAKKVERAEGAIGRMLADGGIDFSGDYNLREIRQTADGKRLQKKGGKKPDDWAGILNDEGFTDGSGEPLTGDRLVELIKSGEARNLFTPDKQDVMIERKLRRTENEWLEGRLADLEGVDAGTAREIIPNHKSRALDEIRAEGLIDPAKEEAALKELDDFFSEVTTPKTEIPRFELGRRISSELGQSSLKPSKEALQKAADKVGVSYAEARRALDVFNDPEGGASPVAKEKVKATPAPETAKSPAEGRGETYGSISIEETVLGKSSYGASIYKDGKLIGEGTFTIGDDGIAKVGMIRAIGGRDTIAPAEWRNILTQLKKKYPQITKFEGDRITRLPVTAKPTPKGDFKTADLEGMSERETFSLINPETEMGTLRPKKDLSPTGKLDISEAVKPYKGTANIPPETTPKAVGGIIEIEKTPEANYFSGTDNEPITSIDQIVPYGKSLGYSDNHFGGLFAGSEGVAESHGVNIQKFYVPKDLVMSHDAMSRMLYDQDEAPKLLKTISEVIKKDKHEMLSDKELSEIADYLSEEKKLFRDTPDMGEERMFEILGRDSIGEADWDIQGLRGEVARRLGYAAVEMGDEHGITTLILNHPGVKLLPNPSRPPEDMFGVKEAPLDKSGNYDIVAARKAGYHNKQLELDLLSYGKRELPAAIRGDNLSGVIANAIPKGLLKRGYVHLNGQKVEGPSDLAAVAQIFRDPRLETLRIFYIKDGKIVGHEGLSSRMPGFVEFYPEEELPKQTFKIAKRAERLEADEVYLLHNHPSGHPRPSTADIRFTESITKELHNIPLKHGMKSVKVKGQVIINHKEYAVITTETTKVPKKGVQEIAYAYGDYMINSMEQGKSFAGPSVPSDLLGMDASNYEAVSKIGVQVKRSKGQATLIFRGGATASVRAIQNVPMGILTGEGTSGYLRGRAREFGAPDVVAYVDNLDDIGRGRALKLIKSGNLVDVLWADGSLVKEAGFDLAGYPILKAEKDVVFGKKGYPSKRVAEDMPIYARNRKMQGEGSLTKAKNETKSILSEVGKMTDQYLGSISTRLANIDPSLKNHLRKMEMRTGQEKAKYIRRVEPMLQKIKKMSKDDQIDFDLARKNGDAPKLKQIIDKYDMWKEYTQGTRAVLNELHAQSKEVGFDVGYRKHFHPRVLIDPKGFLEYFYKHSDWPILQRAIREKETELGRYLEDDEKAHLINSMLRGYGPDRIKLSKPGQLKEREVEIVTPEINKFYMNSDAALLRYITAVTDAVEMRKAFGVTAKGSIAPDDTIGHYILDLLAKGKIKPEHEPVLREIYTARFNEVGTRGLVGLYKNLSYIDTMGSPISAVTQVGDLAWALYKAGLTETISATARALIGKSKMVKEDIGIDMIAKEFSDTSKAASAVGKVFKIIGLEKIDNIGKESLINSVISNAQKKARNPRKALSLERELKPIFENETPALMDDLRAGRITENVQLYAFNTLADFQPIALSEMPEKYLTGGNGRIFYMLKTFTIKAFDAFRREAFQKIKTPGQRVQGFKNLLKLAGCFIAANAAADEIKDLILNRKTSLEDRTVDNLLRLVGISKFVTWQARREGVGAATVRQIAPPFKFIDSLTKDIASAGDGKGLETAQSIPVAGKLYYWWFGKGADKAEKRAKQNTDMAIMRRERNKIRRDRQARRKALMER